MIYYINKTMFNIQKNNDLLEFLSTIEKSYGIKIVGYEAGPRQFVAETLVLTTADNTKYFCKITTKALFIPEVIRGLPLIDAVRASGVKRISYPVKSLDGRLFLMSKNALIVLYNYLPIPQSYDYDNFALGRLIAEIHSVSLKGITKDAPKEDFKMSYATEFENYFEGTLRYQGADPTTLALQKILRIYEPKIRLRLADFLYFGKKCREKTIEMVITHGDAPGNILVKSRDDLYLIDWDDVKLGGAEQDIWMMDHHAAFMEGYKSVRQNFIVDNDVRSFYIYKFYFRAIVQNLHEILGDLSLAHREKHLNLFEESCRNGWILPKLEGAGRR